MRRPAVPPTCRRSVPAAQRARCDSAQGTSLFAVRGTHRVPRRGDARHRTRGMGRYRPIPAGLAPVSLGAIEGGASISDVASPGNGPRPCQTRMFRAAADSDQPPSVHGRRRFRTSEQPRSPTCIGHQFQRKRVCGQPSSRRSGANQCMRASYTVQTVHAPIVRAADDRGRITGPRARAGGRIACPPTSPSSRGSQAYAPLAWRCTRRSTSLSLTNCPQGHSTEPASICKRCMPERG